MASPSVVTVGGQSIVTTGDLAPGVPASAGAGDLIAILIALANGGDRTGVTSGGTGGGTWAQAFEDIATRGSFAADWKVLTGSEGGSYSTPGAAVAGGAQAFRISGADPTNPFHPSKSFNDATTAATAAVSLTGLPECLLFWIWRSQGVGSSRSLATLPTVDIGGTPTNMVQRTTAASQNFHICTLAFPGGSTGSVVGNTGGTPTHRVMLGAIVPPSSGLTAARWKDRASGLVVPAGVRIKDRSGALVTPTGARYKNRAGTVSTLY